MLLGSLVFMSSALRGQWISVILVLVLKLTVALSSQVPQENPVKFDGEFDKFLKDMSLLVYRAKSTVSPDILRRNHGAKSTLPAKHFRKSENLYNSQKAILGDVLMMKLVSYYEDKYKLTRLAPSTTTESITMKKPYTKYNVNQMNTINRVKIHNVAQPRQSPLHSARVTNNGKIKRVQKSNMRKIDERTVPEVVTL